MRSPGIIALIVAYGLSQFFRAALAVLSPWLNAELGASPDALARATGYWFLAFAAMQIPVGWALDKIGPRRSASVIFLVGGAGGALLFALAQTPWHISLAMTLIGIGCAPVLMASFFIIGRTMPAALFASAGALVIGFGSIGNLIASSPLAWAAETFGWRQSMVGLALLSAITALAIGALVRDPDHVARDTPGALTDLLRLPALWLLFPIMLVNYAPAAGIRGIWAGPFATDIFGADAARIGTITLMVALAMIAGNFAYGPLDRMFGTRKWVVFCGNLGGALCCLALALLPFNSVWGAAALMAAIGLFGASFPVIIAHARSFFPPHLMGRGVTLMNLMGISGVGLGQMITGQIHASSGGGEGAYRTIFLFYAGITALGLLIYLFSQDRTD